MTATELGGLVHLFRGNAIHPSAD
ncbi:hypothetical protein P4W15_09590 [Morganella morganii]|nr:hypothetical protein [Morganella morganii]